MITTVLTSIHIVICIFLIIIVLLQHGKGADVGATFGGGSSQTVFGSEGPLPLLNKVTTGAAVFFMLTSLALAYFSANMSGGSVMHAVQPPPPPVGGALQRSPAAVPLPAGQKTAGQTEAAPKQFPGNAKHKTPAKEQKPATAPTPTKQAAPTTKSSAPAAKKGKTPTATPSQPASSPSAGESKK